MSEGESSDEAGLPSARRDIGADVYADILEIEHRRIDRDNHRTAVAEKGLEMEDAANEREFKYATETRVAELTLQRERQEFARKVIWVLVGLGSVVVLGPVNTI